jgi:dipeptide/tripeptide permease
MHSSANIIEKSKSGRASTVSQTSMENSRLLESFMQLSDYRSKAQKRYSVIVILLVNALERFAYYGLLCNYLLYLNKKPMYWQSLDASLITFIFIGLTYISSFLGGWLSDSIFGN